MAGTEAFEKSAAAFSEQVKVLPIGDMVRDIAMGVAKAQSELDMNALRMLREYSKKDIDLYGDGTKRVSLLELGFAPHFLFFQKVNIRVHMELSFHTAEESAKSFNLTANIGYESTKSTNTTSSSAPPPATGGTTGGMQPNPAMGQVGGGDRLSGQDVGEMSA